MASRSTLQKITDCQPISPLAYRQIGNFHFGLLQVVYIYFLGCAKSHLSACFFEKLMPLALKKMVGMKGPHVLQILIFIYIFHLRFLLR